MEPEKTYHLYTHANGFENLFRAQENYWYFLQRYQHFIEPVAHTLAYCLMPNHIHFLITIKSEAEIETAFKTSQTSEVSTRKQQDLGGLSSVEKRISQQFSNLFNAYSKAFNKMYKRRGSLFIPNFKRKEIETDQHLTRLILYIHGNPVHHGFVKNITDWAWSSYHEILSDNKSTWLKREEIINWFGNEQEFIRFHQQRIEIKTFGVF